MLSEEMQRFLLATTFGIDYSNIPQGKALVPICANKAYLDLSRTVDYTYTSKEIENMRKKTAPDKEKKEAEEFDRKKAEFKEEVATLLEKGIADIGKNDWHERLCKSIIDEAGKYASLMKNGINYGQAQKWVNMTYKYLYLFDEPEVKKRKQHLHIPVDNYIIEALWKENIALPEKKRTSFKAWSNWNANDYKAFRESLITEVKEYNVDDPIAWENTLWITMNRNKQ